MSCFEATDPAFNRYVLGNAPVKKLASGFDWVEGPVWFGDANCLLFSDIPNDRILRWTPEAGLSTYRSPSHYANGHTRDLQGRLITCHSAKHVRAFWNKNQREPRIEIVQMVTEVTENSATVGAMRPLQKIGMKGLSA